MCGQILTLNDNELVRLPLGIRFLTNLVEFDASNNTSIDLPPYSVVLQGIAQIRSFVSMVHNTLKSRHLDLTGFALTDVPQFVAGMTGLTALTLASNELTHLEGVMPIVGRLTSLNALGNNLSGLPIGIGGLTSLKELQLEQHVWDAAARDLLLTSSRHVREYLRKLLDAQVRLKRQTNHTVHTVRNCLSQILMLNRIICQLHTCIGVVWLLQHVKIRQVRS